MNQVVTHDFAVRANIMYDQHDVAGRDFADSERWGGLLSATAKPTDDVKVTLDYYRYRNDAMPDWGVPVPRPAANCNVCRSPRSRHSSRDMWVGMKSLDFFKEQADIGTATIVAKLADDFTLDQQIARRARAASTTSPRRWKAFRTCTIRNRDQTAEIYANQTELNVRFTTGTFKHNVVAGVEVTRENIDRDAYNVTQHTLRRQFDAAPFPPNPYQPDGPHHSERPRLRRDDRSRSAFTCSTRSICPNSGSSTAACASTISSAIKSAVRE